MTLESKEKSGRRRCVTPIVILLLALVSLVGTVALWSYVAGCQRWESLHARALRSRERVNKLRVVALSIKSYEEAEGRYPDEIAQLVPGYIDAKDLFLDYKTLVKRHPEILGSTENIREVVRAFGSFQLEERADTYLIEIGDDRQPSNLRINVRTCEISSGPWAYMDKE